MRTKRVFITSIFLLSFFALSFHCPFTLFSLLFQFFVAFPVQSPTSVNRSCAVTCYSRDMHSQTRDGEGHDTPFTFPTYKTPSPLPPFALCTQGGPVKPEKTMFVEGGITLASQPEWFPTESRTPHGLRLCENPRSRYLGESGVVSLSVPLLSFCTHNAENTKEVREHIPFILIVEYDSNTCTYMCMCRREKTALPAITINIARGTLVSYMYIHTHVLDIQRSALATPPTPRRN